MLLLLTRGEGRHALLEGWIDLGEKLILCVDGLDKEGGGNACGVKSACQVREETAYFPAKM